MNCVEEHQISKSVINPNKNITSALRNWPDSSSTLVSYQRCCRHNVRGVSTGSDGLKVLITTVF